MLDQMSDVGYDSYNLILNLGTLAILFTLYILKIIALVFILAPLSTLWPNKFTKIFKKFKESLFFGDLIMMFVEGYMEFLISSTLLMKAPNGALTGFDFLYPVAVVCVVITCGIIPAVYIWLFTRSEK